MKKELLVAAEKVRDPAKNHSFLTAKKIKIAIISNPTEEEKKAFNPMNSSTLDNSKIKGLGYRQIFSVEEELTHTVEILKEIIR